MQKSVIICDYFPLAGHWSHPEHVSKTATAPPLTKEGKTSITIIRSFISNVNALSGAIKRANI